MAIRNDDQRKALDLALQFAAAHPSSHLGTSRLISLKQSLKRFDNVMQKAGVTKKQLGVTAHGLRHQFAQEFHVELTDILSGYGAARPSPIQRRFEAALLEIARQLGHNRRKT